MGDTEQPAHLVLRGATVLTQDADLGELTGADVEVRDGVIAAVGERLAAPGAEVVDATGMIVLPGFVDTHWHLWGTLLRGVIGDGPDHGWFARKGALAPYFTAEDTYLGVRLGAVEGLAAGITTVHDWAHNVLGPEHADANLQAHLEAGTRVHFSYGSPSAHPSLSAEAMREILSRTVRNLDEAMDFADVQRVREQWTGRFDGRLSVGVNVRGPARSATEVYRAEWRSARELGLPIAMHCAGTRAEVARIHQVSLLAADGLLGPDLLLAHCLYLPEQDVRLVAEHGIAVTVSPLSELRLAMGYAPLAELRAAGIDVSLSLDTTAIAASADPFQAMRVALGLANVARQDACAITPRDMLQIATIGGARALGLDAVTGSITPGKRADLICIDARAVNLAPVVDPAVAVVHSAAPANVDTVLVDGRVRKRGGRLVAVDTGELVERAGQALAGVCARAGFEVPVPRP
jgi:cytosine/adenosine deaminase-related metal-dependent hydrolase